MEVEYKQWKMGAGGNCDICHRNGNCESQCQNNKNREKKVIASIISEKFQPILNILNIDGRKY